MRSHLPSLRPSPLVVTSFAHILDGEIHSTGVGGEAVQSCIFRVAEGVKEGIQVFSRSAKRRLGCFRWELVPRPSAQVRARRGVDVNDSR